MPCDCSSNFGCEPLACWAKPFTTCSVTMVTVPAWASEVLS